jgi:hypothetical protein
MNSWQTNTGLDVIKAELSLARGMLQLADMEMAASSDPESAASAVNVARDTLEATRALLPKLNLPETESAPVKFAMDDLDAEVRRRSTSPAGRYPHD